MMEPPEPLARREVLVQLAQLVQQVPKAQQVFKVLLAQSVPQVRKDRQVYKALQVRLAQLAL